MLSDVCKHCVNAGCLEACPTGAIVRTEFDTVVHPAGHLQRLRLLRARLPVRRAGAEQPSIIRRTSARSATTA